MLVFKLRTATIAKSENRNIRDSPAGLAAASAGWPQQGKPLVLPFEETAPRQKEVREMCTQSGARR